MRCRFIVFFIILVLLFCGIYVFIEKDSELGEDFFPKREIRDILLSSEVKLYYLFDHKIDYSKINVNIVDGEVYISGSVADEDDLAYLLNTTEEFSGIKKIISKVKIENDTKTVE